MTRADYTREHRRKNPSLAEANRRVVRARSRALRRLAEMYPEDAQRLTNEERSAEGLPALYVVPTGRPPAGEKHALARFL